MRILIEKTPNPNTKKFNLDVFFPNSREYNKDTKNNEDMQEILDIEGVESVFVSENFISVTKNDKELEWSFLTPQIVSHILNLQTKPKPQNETETQPQNETERKIEKVINERIRGFLKRDGGDIKLIGVENGVARVKFSGACVGCPSSEITLKDGIERTIKHFVPEIKSVITI